MRLTLEVGPKGKKVVAVAPDWPGFERGGANPEAAMERLRAYLPRYAKIAKLAKLETSFAKNAAFEVVERYQGTGSTDFWGISFAFSSIDKQEMTLSELKRELALMRSCWAYFDDVRSRVSSEMKKGPRGGGRDRDHIIRHVILVEQDWAAGVGVQMPHEEMPNDAELKAYRGAYCDAIQEFHAQGKMAGSRSKWPLRYLIRHTAFHTLDHAWEMEDKDLTSA